MKMFHIGQQFAAFKNSKIRGEIVYLKTWNTGLLAGCQLVHIMVNDNPNDVWRIFKWTNGEMNRIKRVERDRVYSRVHRDKVDIQCGDLVELPDGNLELKDIVQELHCS